MNTASRFVTSKFLSLGFSISSLPKATLRRSALVILSMALIVVASYAFGQGTTPTVETAFSPLVTIICGFRNVLTSLIAYALVVIVFVVGVILQMIGNRRGMGLIIGSLVGGLLLASVPTVTRIVLPSAADAC